MKYQLMGVEQTPGKSGFKIKVIGLVNGVVKINEVYPANRKITSHWIKNVVKNKEKIETSDVYIPLHIKNVIDKKE